MTQDRIMFLFVGVFFIIFSFGIRFMIIEIIRRSEKRSEENKLKEIRKGKIISIFLLIIAFLWLVGFILYDKQI